MIASRFMHLGPVHATRHTQTPTQRSLEAAAMFGMTVEDATSPHLLGSCDLALPPGAVILVTGPSGAGKTTMLRAIAGRAGDLERPVIELSRLNARDDRSLIDLVGTSTTDALRRLAHAGLAEAMLALRHASALSAGQRHRLQLALAFDQADRTSRSAVILADEFGASLDRTTARVLAHHLARRMARSRHTLVVATSHEDLTDAIAPRTTVAISLDGAVSTTTRDHVPERDALAEELTIEPGDLTDYEALASLHYRAGAPGVVSRIVRVVHRATDRLAGVAVCSRPTLACALRDIATRDRYRLASRLDGAARLNREMRTISRVIVHPQWRGIGLATRLVRHILETAETACTEAHAAMGQFHPFFERAGMRRYERTPDERDARLRDALRHVEIDPSWMASSHLIENAVRRLDRRSRDFLDAELARWCRSRTVPARVRTSVDRSVRLRAAGRRLLSRPVYYLATRGMEPAT